MYSITASVPFIPGESEQAANAWRNDLEKIVAQNGGLIQIRSHGSRPEFQKITRLTANLTGLNVSGLVIKQVVDELKMKYPLAQISYSEGD